MPQDLTQDKSTLVQVMAWCRQATSHYLSQCWPRSMSPYGITRPQWVKMTPHFIDGLLQDYSNSIANALELQQSCTKPSICPWPHGGSASLGWSKTNRSIHAILGFNPNPKSMMTDLNGKLDQGFSMTIPITHYTRARLNAEIPSPA